MDGRLDYDKIVEQVYDIITEKTDEDLINAYIENKNQENIDKLTTKLEPNIAIKDIKKITKILKMIGILKIIVKLI